MTIRRVLTGCRPVAASERGFDPVLDNPRGGPRCRWCDAPIEWCVGVESDWMHSGTRSERCVMGDLAAPVTVKDLGFAARAAAWRREK